MLDAVIEDLMEDVKDRQQVIASLEAEETALRLNAAYIPDDLCRSLQLENERRRNEAKMALVAARRILHRNLISVAA